MPFKSEKQRRWMWANEPEMAKKWAEEEKNESGDHVDESWEGGENLSHPLDHAEIASGHKAHRGLEVLRITEKRLRKIILQEIERSRELSEIRWSNVGGDFRKGIGGMRIAKYPGAWASGEETFVFEEDEEDEGELLIDDTPHESVNTIMYFYPGLRPESGKDSVKDYLIQKTGDSASAKYVDGHMLLRVGNGLFVIPSDHTVPFADLEEIASSKVGSYEKTKKILGGYSAGSAGVADAQNNNTTTFDVVVLADPVPRDDISWNILTYNPGSWSSYDWYPRRLKRMLQANPSSTASELKNMKHHEHMNNAIDSMLYVARSL